MATATLLATLLLHTGAQPPPSAPEAMSGGEVRASAHTARNPPHPTPPQRPGGCAAAARALRACSHPGSAAQAPTQGGAAAEAPGFDPLWLRYPRVPAAQLAGYRSLLGTSAAVVCAAGAPCGDAASQAQLSAAAAELQTGLSGLLGTAFTATVTSKPAAAGTRLVASVLGAGGRGEDHVTVPGLNDTDVYCRTSFAAERLVSDTLGC